MITAKQKSITYTQKLKRKESKCNTKESHQITREKSTRKRKRMEQNEIQKQSENN